MRDICVIKAFSGQPDRAQLTLTNTQWKRKPVAMIRRYSSENQSLRTHDLEDAIRRGAACESHPVRIRIQGISSSLLLEVLYQCFEDFAPAVSLSLVRQES